MSTDQKQIVRQWVSLPGGSCDVRVGPGAIDAMGVVVKAAVGKPHACALVRGSGATDGVVELVRRQLTDAGFAVSLVSLDDLGNPRTLEGASRLAAELLSAHITSDDLVCAVGNADLLSLAAYVSSSWCAGTPLVHVPTDMASAIIASTTPLGLDVGDSAQMLATKTGAKHEICDPGFWDLAADTPDSLMARALMAVSAICDAEKPVERLWDRADLIVDADVDTLSEQLADTVKSRGHVASSSSVAIKQSMAFGQTFMEATSALLGPEVPKGLLLAEGLRFQSRLAAAQELLSIDDVLTIDELLDLLALEPITCSIEPTALVAQLKAERFRRSGRFLLQLPRGMGRVRAATVTDEMLLEHATAWCESRAEL